MWKTTFYHYLHVYSLTYLNSVGELLMIKLHITSLIIVILIYRPPSATLDEFNDIIVQI